MEFTVILVAVIILILALSFWTRYKTVGPDEAMIITGSFLLGASVTTDTYGRKVKIIRGGGAFIIPIFQQYDYLSMLSHKLDVTTPEVYTEQGVPVLADGVAIIKIGSAVEDIATAAEQFMSKATEDLRLEAQEVLEGHLRAILGTMTVEEVYKNRDRFAQEVQGVAAKDLMKMGLSIVSFTIKDVRDKQGYLEALGRPRIAAVKRDADIAVADAIRDSRVKKALADEEGQKAELLRDTNVAEASKDKEMKVAAFKKEQDMAKAEADQAYNIQTARSSQVVIEEQMKIEVVRKEREIDVQEKEIRRREMQYDAEASKSQQMREADAIKYRIEAEAQGKAAQQRLDGQATAEAELAKGTAEADVIRLKGFAEAEAKEKLAEAFQKFGEAAVLDIVVKMLPELAGKIAEPLKSIDKLTVVDAGGNGSDGAIKVSKYVTSLMATAPDMLKNDSGVDLEKLVASLVKKAPETLTIDSSIEALNAQTK